MFIQLVKSRVQLGEMCMLGKRAITNLMDSSLGTRAFSLKGTLRRGPHSITRINGSPTFNPTNTKGLVQVSPGGCCRKTKTPNDRKRLVEDVSLAALMEEETLYKTTSIPHHKDSPSRKM